MLVDTGTGTSDLRRARPRLSELFVAVDHIAFDPQQTVLAQVRALGFRPEDVRDIVLAHLNLYQP